jgi:vacuolar-type H+-ATPase subunit E/Vma4
MAYYNNDQLLKYFEKNMQQVANKQIESLQLEIQKLYQKEMMKVTEDLQIKHTLEKNRLLKALNVSHQEKINHLGIEYDETLMTLRQNMVAEIFETVTKQLLDYIQSDAYIPAMKHKFDPYAKTHELKQLTVHIKGSDQQLGQFFQSEYPIVKVFSHPNIVIGGFLLTIDDASVEYDHTYDALLKSQKEMFLEASKLFVRE